jgi:long-chain acyl-CoA synthetase
VTTAIQTIPALFAARVAESGARVALREWIPGLGQAMDWGTWRDWNEASCDVAAALVAAGAHRGDAVAVLAGNNSVWPIADIGIILAGLVSVGIYPTASMAQVRDLLADCAARVVIVDSVEQLAKTREAIAGLDHEVTIVRAVAAGDSIVSRPGWEVSWDAWRQQGHDARRERVEVAAEVVRRASASAADDLAMLIYTSGSTGAAKGARISHRYVVESALAVRDTLQLHAGDSSLSFLPFCHAGERIFGLYTRIAVGMAATLVEDHARIWEAGRAVAPTLFGGFPRFFEKVYEGLLAQRCDARSEAAVRWDEALALGRQRSAQRARGEPIPEALETAWRDRAAPIAALLTHYFGPHLRLATSGGAPLPLEVSEYLDACGLTVLGAYGQTEHLCVAFNRPSHYRHGTVGLPMPGTTIRIAEDGEVLVRRSGLTFSGYHRRPEDTVGAFTDDGIWLRTGDLGTVDGDGFLRITGRKKEILALSNGKKVAPLAIEARLCESPLIAHAMLYGEGRPFLTALLSIRPSMVERWRREHGVEGETTDLVRHPAFVGAVQEIVDRVNAVVSRPERVRQFVILPHELTLEAGELTPTHKLRRSAVAARYAVLLDALYERPA